MVNEMDAVPLDDSPGADAGAAPPTLDEWMTAHQVRDEDLADRIGWSRSIVNRVRKGKLDATTKFIEAVIVETKGEVTANSFFRRALGRVAVNVRGEERGGSASPPFNLSCSGRAPGQRSLDRPAARPEAGK